MNSHPEYEPDDANFETEESLRQYADDQSAARNVPAETADLESEARAAALDFLRRVLLVMRSMLERQWVPGRGCTPKDYMRTYDTICLALGMNTVCAAECAADLAQRYGVSRQHINQPLNEFIEELGLPQLPGHRTADSRQAMASARLQQIRKRKRTQTRS